jgi:hypothetical protein
MQNAINFGFVQELWMLGLDGFQFNGHFFARGHVGAEINVAKGTAANFAAQPVLFAHSQFHDELLFSGGFPFLYTVVKRKRVKTAAASGKCFDTTRQRVCVRVCSWRECLDETNL